MTKSPMDKITALKALSLEDGADANAIEQAYQSKVSILDKRIEGADNEGIRTTFTDLRQRMDEARETLLDIQPQAMPLAEAGQMDVPVDDEPHDIHSFIKAQEQQARRHRSYWFALLLIPLFIGVGWYTGFFADMWEQYRPLTTEEQVALDATKAMQENVVERKEGLHAARIILGNKIAQAEEEQSPELPILQETLALADKSVFSSSKRKALEEREKEAQQQLEQRKYFEAEKSYRDVQIGYEELEKTYEMVQVVPVRRAQASLVQQEWRLLKDEYSLDSPEEAVQAEAAWLTAEQKKEQEVYDESIDDYEEAKAKFLAAQIAMADEVAKRKARLAAAREARLKRWKQRLAWLRTITPKMVEIPGGNFTMGSAKGDEDAQPKHKVDISSFKLSRYEIPKQRYQQFVKESAYVTEAEKNNDGLGCAVYNADGSWGWRQGHHWQKVGFDQSDLDPVVCLSWNDAQAYVDWLNKEWDGKRKFKLVSEAEWEYAARAKGTSLFPMGDTLGKNRTVCDGCGSVWDVKRTAPADSFVLNAFGLHAMPGNVWEWTMDCWHDNYQGAPVKGEAWLDGGECDRRVLRGGSWFNKPKYLHSAYRGSNKVNYRGNNLGFRVAETLIPGEKDYDKEE